MSDPKLAVVILDALGPNLVYDRDCLGGFDTIRERYKRNGDVLGISTLPHTAQSNPMIFGGFLNKTKFWVEAKDADEWIDPAVLFEHRGQDINRPDAGEYRNYDRRDFAHTFVWDELDAAGYDPAVIQVPIVLPPFSYNADRIDHESWFPDTQERMARHVREKPEILREHARAGYDFVASSIQMPDKWMHGMAEGKCDRSFVRSEAVTLDDQVARTIDTFEAEGYDWLIFGDHGSPVPGSMPVHEARETLPRHGKEAVIFGSDGLDLPRYTADLYAWMLNYFDVGAVNDPDVVDHSKEVAVDLSESSDHVAAQHIDADGEGSGGATDEVMERLEGLGYR